MLAALYRTLPMSLPTNVFGTILDRLTRLGIEQRQRPTTFIIAAEVYRVRRDHHGNRMVSDAQHVANKPGNSILSWRSIYDGCADRCCFWSMVRSDASAGIIWGK